MARHPELEKNDFYLLRKIFSVCYSAISIDNNSDREIDFLSPGTQIEAIDSGRLSFAFIAGKNDKKIFLKIVKPGYVASNIPYSVLCTEECRLHSSIPTFQTYKGTNGELYQVVPNNIDGIPTKSLQLFTGQIITAIEAAKNGIDTIPEALTEIPGGRYGQLSLMESLGEYIVKVSNAMQAVCDNLPANVNTDDPAGFRMGRQVLMDVFNLDKNITYLASPEHTKSLRKQISHLLPNLKNTPEALKFKHGLEQGDIEFILRRFNHLESKIETSLKSNPAKNVAINNEVKPANVGAVYNHGDNTWKITQSFDFDNIAFGNDKNRDQTPLEKDLGRTLSFFAFDPKTSEFYVDNAQATIKGYLKRLPEKLSKPEIERLQDYIQLGIVTSYLWRSSYFADELSGLDTDILLSRPDPSIHVQQLKAFDEWLENHNFYDFISQLQDTPSMQLHRELSKQERSFRQSDEYQNRRKDFTLKTYYKELDTAHYHLNNSNN